MHLLSQSKVSSSGATATVSSTSKRMDTTDVTCILKDPNSRMMTKRSSATWQTSRPSKKHLSCSFLLYMVGWIAIVSFVAPSGVSGQEVPTENEEQVHSEAHHPAAFASKEQADDYFMHLEEEVVHVQENLENQDIPESVEQVQQQQQQDGETYGERPVIRRKTDAHPETTNEEIPSDAQESVEDLAVNAEAFGRQAESLQAATADADAMEKEAAEAASEFGRQAESLQAAAAADTMEKEAAEAASEFVRQAESLHASAAADTMGEEATEAASEFGRQAESLYDAASDAIEQETAEAASEFGRQAESLHAAAAAAAAEQAATSDMEEEIASATPGTEYEAKTDSSHDPHATTSESQNEEILNLDEEGDVTENVKNTREVLSLDDQQQKEEEEVKEESGSPYQPISSIAWGQFQAERPRADLPILYNLFQDLTAGGDAHQKLQALQSTASSSHRNLLEPPADLMKKPEVTIRPPPDFYNDVPPLEGDGDVKKDVTKPRSADFVEGLDDIDAFFEDVDPPDELDVGAGGTSVQEVLMGQGSQIIRKRIAMGIKKSRKFTVKTSQRVWSGVKTQASKIHLPSRQEVSRAVEWSWTNSKKVWKKTCSIVGGLLEGNFDNLGGSSDEHDFFKSPSASNAQYQSESEEIRKLMERNAR